MSPGFIDMYWGMAADQLRHSLEAECPEGLAARIVAFTIAC
jgi:hypothetical protein